MKRFLLLGLIPSLLFAGQGELPPAFDLRNVGGKSFVSAVKSQSGGTCWTHGAMAAIESNLMLGGAWLGSGETGEANLAEYHLDWWNGFNQHFNGDITPETGGLTVHQGGDYRVAAAYLARGGGAVRDVDAQSFSIAPGQVDAKYRFFYVRDIEWLTVGAGLESLDDVKRAIAEGGAIGTALAWSGSFYTNNTFYQPPSSTMDPNHAVTIVGWDDAKATQAPKPGAWLVKNSWGSGWGNGGYFWLSYHDKIAGRHPEMGAVSFRGVEPMRFKRVYHHDYHGWRDTKNVSEAFNSFVARGGGLREREVLRAVSFYTAVSEVQYTVAVYGAFENGELEDLLLSQEGVMETAGFHTVDTHWPVRLEAGKSFHIYLRLSAGGHPFDKTSNVPLLLGGQGRPIVKSKAAPGQSFYRAGSRWVDLTGDDASANFCIKALAVDE